MKRPQSKFVVQILYGILAGNKVHLSEIARSLNENISLKKTIDRLSRNLFAFKEKDLVMENYISEVKKQINENQAVIVIDNSDITKPCSPKMEAISDVHEFIFYALGYAIERVLAKTRSGIKGFLLKKEQSQQITLAKYFNIAGFD